MQMNIDGNSYPNKEIIEMISDVENYIKIYVF